MWWCGQAALVGVQERGMSIQGNYQVGHGRSQCTNVSLWCVPCYLMNHKNDVCSPCCEHNEHMELLLVITQSPSYSLYILM